MNKLYVIEGQDRCGKSSLVNALRKNIKNPKIAVMHSSKPPAGVDVVDWTVTYYYNLLDQAINMVNEGWDVILDRSWLGESVYGPIYRNVNIGLKTMEEGCLDRIGAIDSRLIVMVDDASSIASRSDGESMSDDLNFLEKERAAFLVAYENTIVRNKEIVDWSYEEFSSKYIEELALEMING